MQYKITNINNVMFFKSADVGNDESRKERELNLYETGIFNSH